MSKGSNYAYYKSLPENLNSFKLTPNSISENQIETNLSLIENGRRECLIQNMKESYSKNSPNFLSFKTTKRNHEEQNNGPSNQNSAEKMFDQIIKLTYICYKNPLPKEEANQQRNDDNSPSHFLKPKSFFSLRKSQKKGKDIKKNLSSSEIILNKEYTIVNQAKNNEKENLAHDSQISINRPFTLGQHTKNDSKTCNIVITNECDTDADAEKTAQKISIENSYISACASTSVIDSVQPNTCFIPSLEYLINNSKSDLFSTQLAIANIAAVAADSEDMNNKNSANVNENVLQTFLMVVAPSTSESKHKLSQLDLTSVASDYSVNFNEKMASYTLQNLMSNETPANLNSTPYYAASGVLGNLNNKLINEQIMRTCMGYLDFIKTKHVKQRRLQAIKNKISGFILLTVLFLFLIALGLVMAISLTKTISKVIIGQSNETIPLANAKNQIEKLKAELNSIVEVNKRTWESKIRNEIKGFLAGLNKKIIGDKSLMSKELQLNFEKNVKHLNFIIFNLLNNLYTKNSIDNEYFIEASIHYLRYIEELN
jgi:hypothetical protein